MSNQHHHHNPCSGGNGFLGGFEPVIRIPERDHNKLENRDEANQHPIEAITNLRTELDQLNKKTDTHDDQITGIRTDLEQINQESDDLDEQVDEAMELSKANAETIVQIKKELVEVVKESDLQTMSNTDIMDILNM